MASARRFEASIRRADSGEFSLAPARAAWAHACRTAEMSALISSESIQPTLCPERFPARLRMPEILHNGRAVKRFKHRNSHFIHFERHKLRNRSSRLILQMRYTITPTLRQKADALIGPGQTASS
jgi:hypothetical protein